MTQTCEMCGKERDLPVYSGQPKTPFPDSGGWRLLSHGSREATLCDQCILLVVNHALLRVQARIRGHAGKHNDQPMTLEFQDVR